MEQSTGVCIYVRRNSVTGKLIKTWCHVDSLEVGFDTKRIIKCSVMGINRMDADVFRYCEQNKIDA